MKNLPDYIQPEISTMEGKLFFKEEVNTIESAQNILDQERLLGNKASCLHIRGKHQIYTSQQKISGK